MVRTLSRKSVLKPAFGDDARWAAVVARDVTHDGTFVYSVATTGVYCRPSCASRQARRANVRFHATCAEAEAAGFRPCKRCRPNAAPRNEDDAAKVAEACRLIETADGPLNLTELAALVKLSPYHFHRLFKKITGVTPKAYAAAHRMTDVRRTLAAGSTITAAFHDAGYASSSQFYATSTKVLGMTPNAYRNGGAETEITFAVGQCSLGAILVAMSPKGICAILLGDDPDALVRDLQDRFAKAALTGGDKDFERIVAKVVGFVDSPPATFDLPLDIRGTAFQHRVWQALRQIPAGTTESYSDIARRIGDDKAVRAVASACAANPIAVAIPCHRVVRTDGALSGYRWGIERKRALLAKEKKD